MRAVLVAIGLVLAIAVAPRPASAQGGRDHPGGGHYGGGGGHGGGYGGGHYGGHYGGGYDGHYDGDHDGHHDSWGHVVVGIGPWGWWGPGFGAWGGGPYGYGYGGYGYGGYGYGYYRPYPLIYPAPYWQAAPEPVVEDPPVYIQRAEPPVQADTYWYYCASRRGYYPRVKTCPEPWVPVPPRND